MLPVVGTLFWDDIKSEDFLAQSFVDCILAIEVEQAWALQRTPE